MAHLIYLICLSIYVSISFAKIGLTVRNQPQMYREHLNLTRSVYLSISFAKIGLKCTDRVQMYRSIYFWLGSNVLCTFEADLYI